MKRLGVLGLLLGISIMGCSKATPLQPTAKALSLERVQQAAPAPAAARAIPGRPGYEPAYYGGQVYTINAIEVPNVAPQKALADFYEVVYPKGWESLGLDPPQCNPCDHEGNGIDPSDYHDHVLDSVPSSPGHGEYRGLWAVYVVVPLYNGNSTHDDALSAAYASHLPAKSEEEVNALLDAHLPDGSKLAMKIDTHFYFLCAVVNEHAAGH